MPVIESKKRRLFKRACGASLPGSEAQAAFYAAVAAVLAAGALAAAVAAVVAVPASAAAASSSAVPAGEAEGERTADALAGALWLQNQSGSEETDALAAAALAASAAAAGDKGGGGSFFQSIGRKYPRPEAEENGGGENGKNEPIRQRSFMAWIGRFFPAGEPISQEEEGMREAGAFAQEIYANLYKAKALKETARRTALGAEENLSSATALHEQNKQELQKAELGRERAESEEAAASADLETANELLHSLIGERYGSGEAMEAAGNINEGQAAAATGADTEETAETAETAETEAFAHGNGAPPAPAAALPFSGGEAGSPSFHALSVEDFKALLQEAKDIAAAAGNEQERARRQKRQALRELLSRARAARDSGALHKEAEEALRAAREELSEREADEQAAEEARRAAQEKLPEAFSRCFPSFADEENRGQSFSRRMSAIRLFPIFR